MQTRTVHDLWIRANGCKLHTLAYRGMLREKKEKITCTEFGPRFSAEMSYMYKLCVRDFTHKVSHSCRYYVEHTLPRFSKSNIIVLDCQCLQVCVCECLFAGKRGPCSDILHLDRGCTTKRGRPWIGEIVQMVANSTCIHMSMC